MSDAFYDFDGRSYIPQLWTRGPWDPNFQHAGPPAALVAREIERAADNADFSIASFAFDVVRSIPLEPLSITTRTLKPGRRVKLVEAELSTADDTIAVAHAWCIRRDNTAAVATTTEPAPFAGPAGLDEAPEFNPWNGPSYFSATEWRMAAGQFFEPGPASAWMRMRIPLLPDETPSPLTRVLVCADSGNGISQILGLSDYLFINVDLSVHLHREPSGEWVGMDAVTRIGQAASGLASSTLYDESGLIGTGNQSLLIAPRS